MIELVPELLAAQDSLERQPLVKMLATQASNSTPFDGAYFNNSTIKEEHTDLIKFEDGRILGVYIRNSTDIVLALTDDAKTTWNETVLADSGSGYHDIAIVQMEDTTIAMVYVHGNYLKVRRIDAETGESIGVVTIESFSLPEALTSVAIAKLSNDSYMIAYSIMTDIETDTFEVRIRTSPDCINWSSDSVVDVSPLLNTRITNNVSLLQISTGELILSFDYADDQLEDGTSIQNIYIMSSFNFGSSWTPPRQITNYTEWGTSALMPQIDERTDGTLAVAFTANQSVLTIDGNTTGYETTGCHTANATEMHFNPATRRLSVSNVWNYLGTKALCNVTIIDIDLWQVVKCYTPENGIHELFRSSHCISWGANHGEAEFTSNASGPFLTIINDVLDTVTLYVFTASDTWQLSKNVDFTPQRGAASITSTWVDSINRRVYVKFSDGYLYTSSVTYGYINLDDVVDPSTGMYPFTVVFETYSMFNQTTVNGAMLMAQERGTMCLTLNSGLWNHGSLWWGEFVTTSLDGGGVISRYKHTTHPTFPTSGIYQCVYYDGCVYGSFAYDTRDNMENNRGMCCINLNTEGITYHEPTWKTANDYGLAQKVVTEDGRIIVAVSGTPGGVAIFDIPTGGWTLLSAENIPGFNPGSTSTSASVQSVAYDELNNQIMCGSQYATSGSGFVGIRMFNEVGGFNIGKLMESEYSGGWVFDPEEDLTIGHSATDQSIAVDDDNVLWSIWTREDTSLEHSIKWDRDIAELALVDLIRAGSSVVMTTGLSKSSTLTFSLANGHLFDPNNSASTWNSFLKKGKIIELQFGEKVGGINYWQTQGVFIVSSLTLSYERGSYPVANVTCTSKDYIWEQMNVPATKRYDSETPENVLTEIVRDFGGLDADKINVEEFPNRHEIHIQWLDQSVKDIVEEITSHFQVEPYFDQDGVFSPKPILLGGPVVHDYDNANIIKFTPDDTFSSHTNRVIVKGEGLGFIEVVYPEELMETIAGTCGWWETGNIKVDVLYSNDKTKICYYPRLDVKKSIESFDLLWQDSKGSEEISYIDPEDRYCTVTIECPSLWESFIALITATISLAYFASTCTVNCGPYLLGLTLFNCAVSYLLARVASYEYDVYAQPVGEEKQLVSGQVDDNEYQYELGGLVVTEEYDDTLCYTTQMCNTVAEYELYLIRAQRNRVSFNKLAHLQDEILDKIRIKHPYSNTPMDIIITDIVRTYTRPIKGSPNNGGFIDSITGWKV